MLTLAEKVLAILLMAVAVGAFAQALYFRLRLVRRGQPLNRFDQLPQRLLKMLGRVCAQICATRTLPVVGLFHALVFFGFLAFALESLNHFARGLWRANFSLLGHNPLARGFDQVVYSFAFLVLVGVGFLAARRYLRRPAALVTPEQRPGLVLHQGAETEATLVSATVFGAIALLMVTYLGTKAFSASVEATVLHRIFWWTHSLLLLGFLVYLGISKHQHLFTGPLNLVFRPAESPAVLAPMDLEKGEKFGAEKVEDLPWKRLLDAFACVQCGRCQELCPAWATSKPLNPKWLIVNLQHLLLQEGPQLFKQGHTNTRLLEGVISPEAVWACTTCGGCTDVCPMGIEHIADLVDIRRQQVLMEGNFPPELANAFRGLERTGNPWGQPPEARADWTEGLVVPQVGEVADPEVLLYVGCAPAYDPRARSVARALVKLLHAAQVRFVTLGASERCNGDLARRTGNEYLYQQLAQGNIARLQAAQPKCIVTPCPHCLHTIGYEYRQLGGNFTVVHHSVYLNQLMSENRLRPGQKLKDTTVTFHDPCYLGRHHGFFDAPREVIAVLPGVQLREMPRHREQSFCCGAGGGQFWKEEQGPRVNQARAKEAAATGAQVIGTACPFCLLMLQDGVKAAGGKAEVRDIAELLADSAGL